MMKSARECRLPFMVCHGGVKCPEKHYVRGGLLKDKSTDLSEILLS